MIDRLLRLLLLATLVTGLPACGQRGPLYLPDKQPQSQQQDDTRQTTP